MRPGVWIGLALLAACGGDAPAPKAKPAPAVAAPAPKPAVSVMDQGPRAPFLQVSETRAKPYTKGLLEDGTRELAFRPWRGPFGEGTSTLVGWYENSGHRSFHAAVMLGKDDSADVVPLPFDNTRPLVGDVELVWMDTDFGWSAVFLAKRDVDGVETQDNHVIHWSPNGPVRSVELSERIKVVADKADVRKLLR